ncbi:MAG: hypothetical protein R3309_14635 [Reinekea sp.]|nr:hypothetical protein [Reinekea sp.]
MLRMVYCIKKRESVSREKFHAYWKSAEHKLMLDKIVRATQPTTISDTLTVRIPAIDRVIRARGYQQEYDAIVDFRWRDEALYWKLLEDYRTLEFFEATQKHGQQWVDFENTACFLTELPDEQSVTHLMSATPGSLVPLNGVRIFHCVKRQPTVSREAFAEYWKGREHQGLLKAISTSIEASSYSSTLALNQLEPAHTAIQMFGMQQAFDAVIDYRWDDPRRLQNALRGQSAIQFMNMIAGKRGQWIDFNGSNMMITEPPNVEASLQWMPKSWAT